MMAKLLHWRGVPMSTPCGYCAHTANWHAGVDGEVKVCTAAACECTGYETPLRAVKPVSPCGARMHSADGMQCDGRHDAAGNHGAEGDGGHRVYWTERVAVYLEEEPAVRDQQVGGDHYQKVALQPWDIWEAYNLDAFTGAILKYLLRDKGNRLEDLKKARHTLDKLIEIEEGRSG